MKLLNKNYEYAGFMFSILKDENGNNFASPHVGQHSAAYKSRHSSNALECWEENGCPIDKEIE